MSRQAEIARGSHFEVAPHQRGGRIRVERLDGLVCLHRRGLSGIFPRCFMGLAAVTKQSSKTRRRCAELR
jgi:hypothetical protein